MQLITSTDNMKAIGAQIGTRLRGGEVIELIGDLGAGKTTLTKGIGEGLGIDEDMQSPSFTISREYQARDDLELHHYDFYRLDNAGVVGYELAESIANERAVTVIEWAATATDVLPEERITITLAYTAEGESRDCQAVVPEKFAYLAEVFA